LYSTKRKRLFDTAVSALGLLLLSPLFALPALLVRLKLGAPALFQRERQVKPFTLLKFRTMTEGRDATGNLLPDAERLAKFGKLLYSSSLDELPELWNVLKGEMSLWGNRRY
jgi:sugar transferase EpsL